MMPLSGNLDAFSTTMYLDADVRLCSSFVSALLTASKRLIRESSACGKTDRSPCL